MNWSDLASVASLNLGSAAPVTGRMLRVRNRLIYGARLDPMWLGIVYDFLRAGHFVRLLPLPTRAGMLVNGLLLISLVGFGLLVFGLPRLIYAMIVPRCRPVLRVCRMVVRCNLVVDILWCLS